MSFNGRFKFKPLIATKALKTIGMYWLRSVLFTIVPVLAVAQPIDRIVEEYIQEGAYEKAQILLVEAIKQDPDPILQDKLGEVYGYQLQWNKAIEVYRELTLLYPQQSSYHFRYGGVLAKKAQISNHFIALASLGKIKASFRKALKLDPGHIEAHWALIDLYVSLPGIVGGSMSKAHDYARQLKTISAVDGYLALGYVYEYDNAPEKAKNNYIKALDFLEEIEVIERNQLNYQIGKICGEFEIEMERGIIHLNHYIHNYTVLDGVPLEWAYYRLAKLYRKKSDKNKALVWINKSLEISPNLKPALAEKIAIERL